MFHVAVGHSQIAFEAAADETILDAAERAGYTLPYSCRKGVCRQCEAGLRDGAVMTGSHRTEGPASILLCRAKPASDMVILPHRIGRQDASARKLIETRVFRLRWVADDVAVLLLRFPVSIRAKFKAGQYLRVATPDGSTRNYSMVNTPGESDGARLHIRFIKGGAFSEGVLSKLREGDRLAVEVPFGDFHLRDDARPAICMATGIAFAPILSMIDDLIERESHREMRVYWSGRDPTDLYLRAAIEERARAHRWLSFVPVLSSGDDPQMRRGRVYDEVVKDVPDLSGWQVYAAGNPLMIRKARDLFGQVAGLPDDQFFGEPFVSTHDTPANGGTVNLGRQ